MVLSMIMLIDGKSIKSSCCVGRQADEEDPGNQGSLKFGRQVVEELESKSSGDDNPWELGISGSNK